MPQYFTYCVLHNLSYQCLSTNEGSLPIPDIRFVPVAENKKACQLFSWHAFLKSFSIVCTDGLV